VLSGRSLGTPHGSYGRGRSVRRDCTFSVAWTDFLWQFLDWRVDRVVPAVDNLYGVHGGRTAHWRSLGLGLVIVKAPAAAGRLTIGSSERGAIIFGEPRRESMMGIKQLRLMSAHSSVAQPHR
jgi:hypothetical protein